MWLLGLQRNIMFCHLRHCGKMSINVSTLNTQGTTKPGSKAYYSSMHQLNLKVMKTECDLCPGFTVRLKGYKSEKINSSNYSNYFCRLIELTLYQLKFYNMYMNQQHLSFMMISCCIILLLLLSIPAFPPYSISPPSS